MFTGFFYTLRKRKVPVSLTEWMTLMEALAGGYIKTLDDFYFLARAILVKSEAFFDDYDIAFQEFFKGIEGPMVFDDKVRDWLKESLQRLQLDDEELAKLNQMSLEELWKELEKRLKEQDGQHDGGSKWVGRGGTSPFGHSGSHPGGIRIGGTGGGRHAVQIAAERRFRNYRNDLVLDVRQIKVALKHLRQLTRVGPMDELALDKTVEATARNYGELEFIWQRRRKNSVKVLLLMDVGGSMEPFAQLCSQLFTAAHSSTHFKDFQYYYFHNCIYDRLYKDIEREDAISTAHILQTLEPDYKVLMAGDARMAPYELTDRYGAIYYDQRNETPGIVWLKRIANHFTHKVWLNPDEQRFWIHPTVRMIGELFPMYYLTIEGLGQAVRKLAVKR